jgi:hypothetical protein
LLLLLLLLLLLVSLLPAAAAAAAGGATQLSAKLTNADPSASAQCVQCVLPWQYTK